MQMELKFSDWPMAHRNFVIGRLSPLNGPITILMNGDDSWLLWQLADSALPTGGFVASGGLEACVQLGAVRDVASLARMVRDSIYSFASASLPFVVEAFDIVQKKLSEQDSATGTTTETVCDLKECLTRLAALDRLYEAATSNSVARRASVAQGTAVLIVAEKGLLADAANYTEVESSINYHQKHDDMMKERRAFVMEFKRMVRTEAAYGHYPVCFGMVCGLLGISRDRMRHLTLFLLARSLISAAVRLGIVGPYGAQEMLTKLRTFVDEILVETASYTAEDAAVTSPLLDIFQGAHDRLYSRLFNS